MKNMQNNRNGPREVQSVKPGVQKVWNGQAQPRLHLQPLSNRKNVCPVTPILFSLFVA